MIKNIIFDMGNVLLSYNPQIPLDLYCRSQEAKDIIRRELFEGPEWVQGDYGYISNLGRYEPVSRRVPAEFHSELSACVKGWDVCMTPVPGALDFCKSVKNRCYKIYVLSNADNSFHDYFTRFAEESFFDGVMVSSDVHMIKPELRIYEHFLRTFGLAAGECLFLDDREENIAGAAAAGIRGYVFRNDYEKIEKCLLSK